ncbi:oxygen-insensitive NADPH nitroreductase [Paenibacillus xerothermodurans]|uniref:Oxygen-insensitive NADPH nitroreductase n=1 Tax=Paenibacillus xerothermodurans TaxID=1977292 RepID=A0A2W1NSG7_PAEXE|nr:oxygen-insensitive NADPH nitroreductase [Paenibacillus xerothermodurans]PZE20696.1 oxygen-insensitive NADPH nitroreductase [Paenibacillus xerothermodurans]
MNDVIKLLTNHRSIRKYSEQPVTDEQLESIISAAQGASTSSNMQAYSIIRVTDQDVRQRLSVLADNYSYVMECPVFLVWCADLYRLRQAYQQHGDPEQGYFGTMENLIVATVDATLAAQNAAVAAESMGMGIVYIGGIRTNIAEVAELLKLPKYVYPVFGMCIGYPDQAPGLRPRLPREAILHENTYQPDKLPAPLADYDHTMKEYITRRTDGKRTSTWSEDMANKLKAPARMHMLRFLESQGFLEDQEDLDK